MLLRLELPDLGLPGVSLRFCIAIANECLLGVGGCWWDVDPSILCLKHENSGKITSIHINFMGHCPSDTRV